VSIHLVGGGRDAERLGPAFAGFVAEGAARAAGSGRMVPRIAVVLVLDDEPDEIADRYTEALRIAGACEPVVTLVRPSAGDAAESTLLSDIDALLVGGGLTPLYHGTLEPLYDEVRLLVADGLPYLGFSAGAMIAAERAIVGGYRIDGVQVCPEETGEDLDDVVVVEGLGLVDLAVDVHAAQWGTLGRLVAAVESGLVPGGVAIDEETALIVGETLRVAGTGSVWQVVDGEDGVMVGTLAP
jgi:cyanophycinase